MSERESVGQSVSHARRETFKTAAFLAVALALVIAASLAEPDRRAASVFSDEGEAFYPRFRDPQSVKAIEVVDYDESTATARPLKVEFHKGVGLARYFRKRARGPGRLGAWLISPLVVGAAIVRPVLWRLRGR